MAKQVGPVLFTGTLDGIIFYKLGDKYYSRAKGSYKSAKHMRRNPRYKRTLEKADQFALASKLAHEVYYYHLPKSVRKHGLYGKLTGLANTWLQEGKSKEEVLALLIAHCQQLAASAAKPATPSAAKAVKPTINAQPTPITGQHPTNTEQPSSIIYPLSSKNIQPSAVNYPLSSKHPCYLSRWKVKRNGRLHIPAYSPGTFSLEPMGSSNAGGCNHMSKDRCAVVSLAHDGG